MPILPPHGAQSCEKGEEKVTPKGKENQKKKGGGGTYRYEMNRGGGGD